MTTRKPFARSAIGFIVIAGLAGALAGALAVYVTSGGSGNGEDVAAAFAPSPQCEIAEGKMAAISQASRGEVAAMVPAQPPRRLELAFRNPEGADVKTDDFAGRTLLVNLWATWCGPCREEMPALNALQQQLGGEDFEVVAINIDTGGDEKPKEFLAEHAITDLGYYRDASMGVFTALKREGLAFGLPATLLLNDRGCLLAAMNGPAAWDSDDAKALIAAARQ